MLREPASGLAAEQRLALGGFVLDVTRGELLDTQGRPAGLRAQALKLLLVLGDHVGQVVGKEELQRRVWGDVIVTEDSIVQGIGDIRRVLGDEGHTLLRTVPRRGYLLDAQPAGRPSALVGAALPPSIGWGPPGDDVAAAAGVAPLGVGTRRRRAWPAASTHCSSQWHWPTTARATRPDAPSTSFACGIRPGTRDALSGLG
jgi:DNA-binding winged helix-turn-helix (wHTH) protein